MPPSSIIYLSTYPPRECGIATFTKDVSDSLHEKYGQIAIPKIIAMQESSEKHRQYPKKVFFTLDESKIEDYGNAAEKINSAKNADVLNIQHEFGIFGGDYGCYLLKLMEKTGKKIVTAFHTVLEEPDEKMKDVVAGIAEKSEKIVVMTNNAKAILAKDYGISEGKIEVIHHGTPNINIFKGRERIRKTLGVENSKVLLTFGMLSRGKGLEYTIKAMPEILEKHPEAIYIIVGQTHPKVRELEGESYREELQKIIAELKLESSIKFVDRYLKLDEIVDYLKAADIYLAPSIDPMQVCSGTVSYAMAAGRAIVASRNKYNEEMLAEGGGVMIPENDPLRFAEETIKLLDDAEYKDSIEKRAYEYSRKMIWGNVATKYYSLFRSLSDGNENYFSLLPKIDFSHVYDMCDDFGMLQFSDYSRPLRQSGYTLDDNARGLVVSVKAFELKKSGKMLGYAEKFLNFIEYCQTGEGSFHNTINEKKEFTDEKGSEESFGRAVCALGVAIKSSLPEELREKAKRIFSKALPKAGGINSPRAQAKLIIGLLKAREKTGIPEKLLETLIDSLISKYNANASNGWKWFEGYLTYANATIPKALFEASNFDKKGRALEIAKLSLDFLTKTHFMGGKLVPIGQDGWFVKGKKRALYDQQPIEAAEMTRAYLKAFEITKNEEYLENARDSFEWFFGRNSLGMVVYDDSTGGCFDGITRTGVNLNQGAESTLVYLEARLSLEKALRNKK